jgi:preprotein translocase subunit SecE
MFALILFIHVKFLEYLSFKQFKLIVKMTRIESGVTIPKGLFTLYLNVKKVTAKIFWPTKLHSSSLYRVTLNVVQIF